jgi:hypothetical protein
VWSVDGRGQGQPERTPPTTAGILTPPRHGAPWRPDAVVAPGGGQTRGSSSTATDSCMPCPTGGAPRTHARTHPSNGSLAAAAVALRAGGAGRIATP